MKYFWRLFEDRLDKYLHILQQGNAVYVSYNKSACTEMKTYHGYFALVSNCEKSAFECLYKYRKRELIESYFESMKQRVDGTRVRVWDADTLRGRMFVQFVALCYYEYLNNELRDIKQSLNVKNGDPKHDTQTNLLSEKKLKNWLEHTPVYLVLQWFDVIEGVIVSSKLIAKRWTTEITLRDKMFLEKIGVKLNH